MTPPTQSEARRFLLQFLYVLYQMGVPASELRAILADIAAGVE